MMLRFALPLGMLMSFAAPIPHVHAEPLQSAIDRQLALNAQRYGIAGQAVLILHDGKTLYRGSQGLARRETNEPVHPNDIFPAYSISKLFVSVLLMQLVEQGQLDLDKPVGVYLPDLPAAWRSVKVNEILDHVSGLPDYFDGTRTPIVLPPTREAIFKSLADKPFLFTPGAQSRYTQTNFLVLGALLEAHYKTTYRQIVTDRIVKPLGLRDTYFGKSHVPAGKMVSSYIGKDHQLTIDKGIDWPEYGIVHAELYTTIDDLGLFLNALCQGRLVKRETLLSLWKPYRYEKGGVGWVASGWEYGTSGRYQNVGHDGGTKTRVRLLFRDSLTKDTYAFIYLTNGSAENVWSRTLIDSLMPIVSPHDFQ